MRKFLLLLCCVLCLQGIHAQRSSHFISPDRLFREGKYMYDTKNYAGCTEKLLEYKKMATGSDLIQEADFLLAASGFYEKKESAGLELKYYLDKYPVNRHRDEACFMIGSTHFSAKDYRVAIYWFGQVELDNLSLEQQEDYAYRLGFCYLEANTLSEAKRLYSLLRSNSVNYRNAATFYLAYLFYTENDFKQALPLFNQIKDQSDFRPEVLYYLTQINFMQGRYLQTINEGINLLNAYPSNKFNTEINRLVGLSYYHEKDYPKTIQYLRQYIASAEKPDSEDLYIFGLTYFHLKDYPNAIEYLNRSNPTNTALGQNTYLYLGQSYLGKGDKEQALMAFQSASYMDFDPQIKEASLYNYAMLLHQNSVSAFGESVTVLENFLNAYPRSMYSDKVNDALVDVYLTTKNYETALASIAKIKNPANKILEARQKIYFYLGTVNYTNGNYDEAITNFTRSIAAGDYAVNEKNEAIYWRGETHYKTGDYAKAANDFQAYLNSGNKSGNLPGMALYNLAYCAFNRQQYKTAETGFLRFINQEKSGTSILADAYARLGDCYFYDRQFDNAENAYNKAVSTMPAMGDYALFQKGYIMGLQKNYQGKIGQMDKLITDYPQSTYLTDALYEKGRTYVLMENNKAAIETYQSLCTRFPESSNARKAGLQIGLLYFNDNQSQNAVTAYKQVIEKYPGSEEAKVAVQDLKSVYFDLNDVGGYADYVKSLGGAARFDVTEQDSLTYLAAERFFIRNDSKQAQKALLNYLQSFPSGAFSTNAHYYLGQTYYAEKQYAPALQEFEKVLQAGNNQFTEETVARVAELQFSNGDYASALASFERLQNTAENKKNRDAGAMGIVRSATQLNKPTAVVTAANLLLKSENIDPSVAEEAKYFRAKALMVLNEKTLAEKDLQDLSEDTRTVFGAEAKYLLAQYYFDNKQTAKAKEIVRDYIKQGTPHAYWLARSFILMSDIFDSEGDTLQARQYLESLQNNYTNKEDDIQNKINSRLEAL
ncbi:MAG: tetratricopeptide repeat protein [Dysgonamonadaceae bacterium]|nr:tetratricopeptide repeat protein [Dysgonamonadaceae bacterium]